MYKKSLISIKEIGVLHWLVCLPWNLRCRGLKPSNSFFFLSTQICNAIDGWPTAAYCIAVKATLFLLSHSQSCLRHITQIKIITIQIPFFLETQTKLRLITPFLFTPFLLAQGIPPKLKLEYWSLNKSWIITQVVSKSLKGKSFLIFIH